MPAASLDADDPVDPEDESDSSEDEDDTEALLLELNNIKKERALGKHNIPVSSSRSQVLMFQSKPRRKSKSDKKKSGSEWKTF